VEMRSLRSQRLIGSQGDQELKEIFRSWIHREITEIKEAVLFGPAASETDTAMSLPSGWCIAECHGASQAR
jgi:hypothetical protein